jgi:hypothetical protein
VAQPACIIRRWLTPSCATDWTGEVYDDPSEDALFMLMEDRH